MRKQYQIPDVSLNFPTARYSRKTGKTTTSSFEVLCPHLFFSALSETDEFASVYSSPDKWAEFWKNAEGETWFEEHPLKSKIQSAPTEYCPCVIWGNDAPTSRRVGRNFRCISHYCPLVCEGEADDR